MNQIVNTLEDKIDYLESVVEESLDYAIENEPFFQWVLNHPLELNAPLINGLISNLKPLKEAGRHFYQNLLESEHHKQALEKYKLNPISNQQKVPSEIGYEVLTQMGYTGPQQTGSPAACTLYRQEQIKFRNRGLAFNKKGNLILNSNIFAKYVLKRMKLIRYGAKEVYIYDKKGKYLLVDEDFLKKIFRNLLHEARDNIWSKRWEDEYFLAVNREQPFVELLNPHTDVINLKNGMLDLRKMKLLPHSPTYYSTIQIEMNYDPKATCPLFIDFLNKIFNDDQELVNLVQEILGYCFVQDIKIQKAFIFLGKGSNGKSVLAEVIRQLIGTVNVANVPLSELSGRFGMQNLPEKLVNISSENEFDKKFNTEVFKRMTGGDAVNVEQKYKTSFNMKLFAKTIILLNRMMDSDDTSLGFYRRLQIIPFNTSFKELKAGEIPVEGVNYMDKNLTDKLLTELEGILTFALEGLQRLVRNDFNLTHSTACEEALNDYIAKQNPVIVFYQDMIRRDPMSKVKRSEFRNSFVQWALNNGYEEYASMGASKFMERFKNVLDEEGIHITEKRIRGIMYVTGIRIESFYR